MPPREAPALATVDTDYSADVVEFCPTPGARGLFVCGTYQLLRADGSKAPAPGASGSDTVVDSEQGKERTEVTADVDADEDLQAEAVAPETSRTGRLYLFSLDDTTPVEKERHETAAILDAKWDPHAAAPELAVADAKGAVTFFNLEDNSLRQTEKLQLAEESTLVLSLAYAPVPDAGLITSLSDGRLMRVMKSESGYVADHSCAAHDFEPWICSFGGGAAGLDTIWSGGDDCVLKRWDARSYGMTGSHRRFDGGVTTIAPCPDDENVLAVGSYDSRLRLFDVRNLRSPVGEIELPGGIWRTKWRGKDVLNACMHGGFAVVHVEGGEMEVTTTFPGTLGYGADWCRDEGRAGVVATCSFYDHVMNVWRVDDQ